MNEFTRQTMLEDSFNEMHKIKPEVHYQRLDKDSYNIKLIHKGKEAIIKEVMEHGFPKFVTLEIDGVVKDFKFPYQAENEAVRILKGKDKILEEDTIGFSR